MARMKSLWRLQHPKRVNTSAGTSSNGNGGTAASSTPTATSMALETALGVRTLSVVTGNAGGARDAAAAVAANDATNDKAQVIDLTLDDSEEEEVNEPLGSHVATASTVQSLESLDVKRVLVDEATASAAMSDVNAGPNSVAIAPIVPEPTDAPATTISSNDPDANSAARSTRHHEDDEESDVDEAWPQDPFAHCELEMEINCTSNEEAHASANQEEPHKSPVETVAVAPSDESSNSPKPVDASHVTDLAESEEEDEELPCGSSKQKTITTITTLSLSKQEDRPAEMGDQQDEDKNDKIVEIEEVDESVGRANETSNEQAGNETISEPEKAPDDDDAMELDSDVEDNSAIVETMSETTTATSDQEVGDSLSEDLLHLEASTPGNAPRVEVQQIPAQTDSSAFEQPEQEQLQLQQQNDPPQSDQKEQTPESGSTLEDGEIFEEGTTSSDQQSSQSQSQTQLPPPSQEVHPAVPSRSSKRKNRRKKRQRNKRKLAALLLANSEFDQVIQHPTGAESAGFVPCSGPVGPLSGVASRREPILLQPPLPPHPPPPMPDDQFLRVNRQGNMEVFRRTFSVGPNGSFYDQDEQPKLPPPPKRRKVLYQMAHRSEETEEGEVSDDEETKELEGDQMLDLDELRKAALKTRAAKKRRQQLLDQQRAKQSSNAEAPVRTEEPPEKVDDIDALREAILKSMRPRKKQKATVEKSSQPTVENEVKNPPEASKCVESVTKEVTKELKPPAEKQLSNPPHEAKAYENPIERINEGKQVASTPSASVSQDQQLSLTTKSPSQETQLLPSSSSQSQETQLLPEPQASNSVSVVVNRMNSSMLGSPKPLRPLTALSQSIVIQLTSEDFGRDRDKSKKLVPVATAEMSKPKPSTFSGGQPDTKATKDPTASIQARIEAMKLRIALKEKLLREQQHGKDQRATQPSSFSSLSKPVIQSNEKDQADDSKSSENGQDDSSVALMAVLPTTKTDASPQPKLKPTLKLHLTPASNLGEKLAELRRRHESSSKELEEANQRITSLRRDIDRIQQAIARRAADTKSTPT